MASVNFLYRSNKSSAFLNLRLLFRNEDKDFVFGVKTKVEVSREYWAKQHKKKSRDIAVINQQTEIKNELAKIESYLLGMFHNTNVNDVDKDWLYSQINYYYNPVKQVEQHSNELLKYFQYYMACKKESTSIGTQRKYNSTYRLVERFQKERSKVILIKDVNEKLKVEFAGYCKEKQYAQNTISKFFKTISGVCNHAEYNGIETSHQLKGFKVKQYKGDHIYLTSDDLQRIESIEKNLLTESLETTRDWLIISCYTGQRISDFMRFNDEQIRLEQGKPLIEFTQQKTGKIMTIALPPKVIDILKTRNGKFPKRISDQKYNDAIKIVCKIAGLNQPSEGMRMQKDSSGVLRKKSGIYKKYELVTSHIGRRSFATNFYGTIPTSYLTYTTGHSTEAMFLNYIGKSNKDIALEMTKYFL